MKPLSLPIQAAIVLVVFALFLSGHHGVGAIAAIVGVGYLLGGLIQVGLNPEHA